MKKNLTFLMMLMAFVGVLSAQSGPKFNYQAVVRNADTLVYDQTMSVAITVTDGTNTYEETHATVTSSKNGLVSLIVGGDDATGKSGNLALIDWSKANIKAVFKYGSVELMTASTPVKPVPYALQAGLSPLTTERITNYLHPLSLAEAKQVLDALVVDNPDLHEDIEDAIEAYLKTAKGKDIAVDVAKDYADSITASDVEEVYLKLKANPNYTAIKNEFKTHAKQYVSDNITEVKETVKELVTWYMQNATIDDVHNLYDAVQNMVNKTAIKQTVRDSLENFAKSQGFHDLIVTYAPDFINGVTAEEAANATDYFKPAVKTQVRDTIYHYVQQYLATHSTSTDVNDQIDHAIDNYVGSHLLIPIPPTAECPTIDACELKALYDLVPTH